MYKALLYEAAIACHWQLTIITINYFRDTQMVSHNSTDLQVAVMRQETHQCVKASKHGPKQHWI